MAVGMEGEVREEGVGEREAIELWLPVAVKVAWEAEGVKD